MKKVELVLNSDLERLDALKRMSRKYQYLTVKLDLVTSDHATRPIRCLLNCNYIPRAYILNFVMESIADSSITQLTMSGSTAKRYSSSVKLNNLRTLNVFDCTNTDFVSTLVENSNINKISLTNFGGLKEFLQRMTSGQSMSLLEELEISEYSDYNFVQTKGELLDFLDIHNDSLKVLKLDIWVGIPVLKHILNMKNVHHLELFELAKAGSSFRDLDLPVNNSITRLVLQDLFDSVRSFKCILKACPNVTHLKVYDRAKITDEMLKQYAPNVVEFTSQMQDLEASGPPALLAPTPSEINKTAPSKISNTPWILGPSRRMYRKTRKNLDNGFWPKKSSGSSSAKTVAPGDNWVNTSKIKENFTKSPLEQFTRAQYTPHIVDLIFQHFISSDLLKVSTVSKTYRDHIFNSSVCMKNIDLFLNNDLRRLAAMKIRSRKYQNVTLNLDDLDSVSPARKRTFRALKAPDNILNFIIETIAATPIIQLTISGKTNYSYSSTVKLNNLKTLIVSECYSKNFICKLVENSSLKSLSLIYYRGLRRLLSSMSRQFMSSLEEFKITEYSDYNFDQVDEEFLSFFDVHKDSLKVLKLFVWVGIPVLEQILRSKNIHRLEFYVLRKVGIDWNSLNLPVNNSITHLKMRDTTNCLDSSICFLKSCPNVTHLKAYDGTKITEEVLKQYAPNLIEFKYRMCEISPHRFSFLKW